ncbi:unnamed protein product, partial [Meganyctiphanes norvegica]
MSAAMQENNPLLELFIQQLAAAKLAQAIKAAQENGGVFPGAEAAAVGFGLGVGAPEAGDGQNRSTSSPSTSPRRQRRESGSVGSRDDGPGSPRLSPRESLTSSPQTPRSPRATPPQSLSQFLAGRPQDSLAELAKLSSRGPIGINNGDFNTKSPSSSPSENPLGITGPRGESPLDLSAPRKRAAIDDPEGAMGKIPHVDMTKGMGAWPFPLPPQLAYLALRPDLAALTPDLFKQLASQQQQKMGMGDNATKLPPSPIGLGASGPSASEAAHALERMSELSKLSGNSGMGGQSANRATPWQNHWLSKGQDTTKDILKCVWCKISFNSMEELTTHMKEAKHFGPNSTTPMPQMSPSSNLPPHYGAQRPPNPNQFRSPNYPPTSSGGRSFNGSSSSSDNLMPSIRDGINLPRKLVRGQDVWLGKGAEQTRQILKCMWCGQSFKTLQDMTTHMQKTKHYANIISQEQIISWKSPDEKTSTQQHVNAVLTCKVCDLAFTSLKELSDHMVKNAHYKEHIMRSISESGMRKRPSKEKRKKTLPVRKLLELERAQQDMRGYSDGNQPGKDPMNSGKILCDKCDEKIDAMAFIDHIHNCEGKPNNGLLKSALLSPSSDINKIDSVPKPEDEFEGKKQSLSPNQVNNQNKSDTNHQTKGGSDSFSALNSLENLIKSSFEPSNRKARPGGPLGSSILRRLGIDEAADYSKPIMDPQLAGIYSGFPNMHNNGSMSPGKAYNMQPPFPYEDRRSVIQGVRDITSPGIDSDTSDTFNNSPIQRSRPDSNGSASKEWSNNNNPISHSLQHSLRLSPTLNNSDDNLNNGCLDGGEDNPEKEHEEINNIKGEPEDNLETEDNIKKEAEDNDSDFISKDTEKMERVQEIRVKDEFKLKDDSDEVEKMEIGSNRDSPATSMYGSPSRSCAGTPQSESGSTTSESRSGLSAMAAMLGGPSSGGGGSENPLAALQMLCEKTEKPKQPRQSLSQSSNSNNGSMLAFSWACNDAVTADSIIKCALCDTPFISKGAYRHHLSKMHFLKDGGGSDNEQGPEKNALKINKQQPSARSKTVTPPSPSDEDTPQSRFLKYTELAKQLSGR